VSAVVDATCDNYLPIDPNEWECNSESERPLGYYYMRFHSTAPEPCVILHEIQNRNIEIMVETVRQTKVCYRDANSLVDRCESGQFLWCWHNEDQSDVQIQFYRDGGNSNIEFYVRFRNGTGSAGGVNGWCEMMQTINDDLGHYPSDCEQPASVPKFHGDPKSSETKSTPKSNGFKGVTLWLPIVLVFCLTGALWLWWRFKRVRESVPSIATQSQQSKQDQVLEQQGLMKVDDEDELVD